MILLSLVDFLRNLFSRTLGLGSGEKVLDELTLDGVASYIKSGACEYIIVTLFYSKLSLYFIFLLSKCSFNECKAVNVYIAMGIYNYRDLAELFYNCDFNCFSFFFFL